MTMDADQIHDEISFSSDEFDGYYLAYPLGKDHLHKGNKIIMPPSALNHLASLPIVYPMLFRLENVTTGLHSHCGVLEFTADEGLVFLPTWTMNNMQLEEGELVNIKNTSLPKGIYIKIQPHATKFITLSDHKSLLEETFRDFACLTTGDTIMVNHGEEKYVVDIVETKPSAAISLFDTDCEVEFAPPLDYKEPEKKPISDFIRKGTSGKDQKNSPRNDEDAMMKEFKPFAGVGRRLDGAQVDGQPLAVKEEDQSKSNIQVKVEGKDDGFKAFTGKSFRLGG